MTKQIQLSKGLVALVDDEDFEWLSEFKWCVNDENYAIRNVQKNGKWTTTRMHRDVLNAPDFMQVDHVNCNPLDNRRCNLRLATNSQNQRNRGSNKNNKSGFKGVSWRVSRQKWLAQIEIDGKGKHLGYFDTPEDAAQAYDKAARELHGEFAKTNF